MKQPKWNYTSGKISGLPRQDSARGGMGCEGCGGVWHASGRECGSVAGSAGVWQGVLECSRKMAWSAGVWQRVPECGRNVSESAGVWQPSGRECHGALVKYCTAMEHWNAPTIPHNLHAVYPRVEFTGRSNCNGWYTSSVLIRIQYTNKFSESIYGKLYPYFSITKTTLKTFIATVCQYNTNNLSTVCIQNQFLFLKDCTSKHVCPIVCYKGFNGILILKTILNTNIDGILSYCW